MLAGPNPRAPRGCTCDCVSNPHFPTHGFNFVFREAYVLHPGAGLAECTPFAAIPGSCLVGYSHLSALCRTIRHGGATEFARVHCSDVNKLVQAN